MSEKHPIAAYLSSADLTVSAFAESVGINRVSMHRIISGKQTPSPETAKRICAASNGAVTLADIYAHVGEAA